MRNTVNLNYNWYFKEKYEASDLELNNYHGFNEVELPHTQKIMPYNYFNLDDYLFSSSYKRVIRIEKDQNKSYILRFLGIAQSSKIYLNGEFLKENLCGYNEINLDITDKIKDGDNELFVYVSSEEGNFPPFGYIVDYLGYGGIYRECYLIETDKKYIENAFLYTSGLLTDKKVYHLSVDFNDDSYEDVHLVIKDMASTILDVHQSMLSGVEKNGILPSVELWSAKRPKLYNVTISILKDGKATDSISFDYGFREIKGDKTGLYINGEKFLIRGLDRHQSYPYVGYAMPKEMQRNDAHILKDVLGVNAVRCSHYMNHPEFLNECDKLGLIVYEEFPGWQYIGNEEWKAQAIINLNDMIIRDRNHPSILFFGVRINESPDDKEFNKLAYERAKELDPTRIITGTRCHTKGLDFDDCYTYNNFFKNLTPKTLFTKSQVTNKKNPYLITEYCGHMYPNKQFDNEIRRTRASLLHKNVISKVEKENDIFGALGWVFADYNTHKAFGANDMICYHGVLDMWRNPKSSAFTYMSYRDNAPFIECSSNFGSGEYDGSYFEAPLVYTNCERVEVYRDNKFIGTYNTTGSIDKRIFYLTDVFGDSLVTEDGLKEKDAKEIKKTFAYVITHKYNIAKSIFHVNPFSIKKTIKYGFKYLSNMSSTFTFKGYVNDKEVSEIKRGYGYFEEYEPRLSSKSLLIEDTYGVIELTLRASSNLGETMKYLEDTITITPSSGLEIIGPSSMSVLGGYASFYLRNKENKDSLESVIVKSNRGKDFKVEIKVEKVV